MIGKCKWFSREKSFGFLEPANGEKDVFVHISQLAKSGIDDLMADELVTFDIREGKKGPEACNIKLIQER